MANEASDDDGDGMLSLADFHKYTNPISSPFDPPANTLDQNQVFQRYRLRVRSGSDLPQSRYDLGDLRVIPLEIMHQILDHADLATIKSIMDVNRQASRPVHSHPKYRTVLEHAPMILQAIYAIQVGASVSIARLYELFTDPMCTQASYQCDQFGCYVYLPTCERTCWLCISYGPCFRLLSKREVKRLTGFPGRTLKHVDSLKCLPGTYSFYGQQIYQSYRLYDARSALRRGASHGEYLIPTYLLEHQTVQSDELHDDPRRFAWRCRIANPPGAF